MVSVSSVSNVSSTLHRVLALGHRGMTQQGCYMKTGGYAGYVGYTPEAGMEAELDPKLTLDEDEWRFLKRTTRQLRHRRRLEEATEANTAPWLAALERDDLTDPVERELEQVPS